MIRKLPVQFVLTRVQSLSPNLFCSFPTQEIEIWVK